MQPPRLLIDRTISSPRPNARAARRATNGHSRRTDGEPPGPHRGSAMTRMSTDRTVKSGDGIMTAAVIPLSADELRKMDAYWRASNYLSVGQIYLLGNPLL